MFHGVIVDMPCLLSYKINHCNKNNLHVRFTEKYFSQGYASGNCGGAP